MRFILIAFFFIALGSTMAENYVELSITTVLKSQLIQDLRQLGAEYTLQQGIFGDTKTRLENGHWVISNTESVETKIAGAVTYYKFTVIIKSNSSPCVIRATYIVSFRPTTGRTLVTFYHYDILPNGDDDEEYTFDLPQFQNANSIANNTYFSAKFQEGYGFTIKNAIAQGQIQNATYHAGIIFSAGDGGYSTPWVLNFLVTLVTENGYTYRAKFFVPDLEDTPENEWADHPITYVIYPNQ